MVEYSEGYKAKAQKRLKALDDAMKPQARAVARGLSKLFEKSASKQRVAKPRGRAA